MTSVKKINKDDDDIKKNFDPTCEGGGGFGSPPLAEIIIAPNSVNKTSFLVIDFMDMVIRQFFVKEKI